ncbi:MAG: serine/threonine protein kinase [Acidobacteria bacterium]|nr:serine/threonine protein kinase [Acidobacteriota bacterium]
MVETLSHYKILDRIGGGAMGELYRARDTQLGRTVALRVIAADVAADTDRRQRFLSAARAATALSHPNIAMLYEIGVDQGQLFLVCEYARGDSLKTVIAGRPVKPRRAIDLAVQVADALADAHALGIVHGDIRPDNIIVTTKGNAKILDFGLAPWTGSGAARRQAASLAPGTPDASLGTVAYLSPEQALGEQGDSRTDIFSLGIVLFEMLTGRPPFTAASSGALTLQIVQASAPAPSTVIGSLPAELDPILGRALAKSLDRRYETAATFAAELRSVAAVLDVRSEASEAAGEVVAPRPPRRSSKAWVFVLLALAALAAAAWLQRDAILRLLR